MPNTIDSETLRGLGLLRQPQGTAKSELGQDEFLKLMTTQLRNQDPFSPMESGEFLGQLAQFGTVSGIEDVRGALESLAQSLSANQTMQAAALVDRHAFVPAREAWLPPGGVVRGAAELPPGTAHATLAIYDMNGRLVASRSLPVSGEAAGSFVWDGLQDDGRIAPSGYYELRATGDVAGSSTALDMLVAGRIESVSLGNAGGNVSLTVTGLGQVDMSDVRRVSGNLS